MNKLLENDEFIKTDSKYLLSTKELKDIMALRATAFEQWKVYHRNNIIKAFI